MNAADLDSFITSRAIAAQIVFLADETPTVETAAAAVGITPVQIVKSVLFLVKEEADAPRPVLVIGNGYHRIDWRRLADYLAVSRRRLRLADAEQVQAITGFPVGTVPPFGHRTPLPTLLDEQVLAQTLVYAGGGAINALMRLHVAELQRVLQAPVVNLTKP